MADSLRVNGNMLSWGSLKFKVGGDLYSGFTAISYGDKRERVKGYGMGRHHSALGMSAGKYSVEPIKVTGRKASVRALIKALAAQSSNGASYGDVRFEGVLQGVEEGSEDPINDTFEGCVVTAVTASHEESADPLSEDLEIECMRIRRDGLTLWDSREGTAL